MEEQIEDNQSTTSKHGAYKLKICAHCGKSEGKNWYRHCKEKHAGVKKEWDGTSELIEAPWCENWKQVHDGVKPTNIHSSFKPGFKAGNKLQQKKIIKAEASVSDMDSETLYNESQFAPEEIQNGGAQQIQIQIQEEVEDQNFVAPLPLKPKNKAKSTTASMLGKRLHIIDEPTEEELKTSFKKVKAMFAASSHQDFVPPSLPEQTVYRDQGMRDQEAILKLRLLDNKTVGTEQQRVLELVELTSMLTQITVSAFIEKNKANLPRVKDLLLKSHRWVGDLSVEEITSIAFASVLFGGSVWASLPKMLNSLESSKLEDVLLSFQSLLSIKLNDNIATWVCTYWRYLEEQTLPLLRYIKDQPIDDSLSSDIVTISRMVMVVDTVAYFNFARTFSKFSAFKVVINAINVSAPQWTPEKKLSFHDFSDLVGVLASTETNHLLKVNEQDILGLQMCQWKNKLTELQAASIICDVESIQYRLDQLSRLVGILPSDKQSKDLTCSEDGRFQRTLNVVPNAPNALQFANAQYAAFGFTHWRRQMWMIPSGQGKSRTLAMITLILLLTGATTKVHLVCDTEHFMKRDQREFADWWKMHGLIANVEYHIGLNFETKPGDVILIDEADQVILSNHSQFEKKVKSNRCICMTATPDNENKRGVEREILNSSGFKFINGCPEGVPLPTPADASCLQILALAPDADLIQHTLKVLIERAVLLYCPLEFQQLLVTANVLFVLIEEGKDIDDEFLRTLDRFGQDGLHTLIVTSSPFGMRAFDYRSSQKGITLIIAESFEHQRQATQGLSRVGRFGDPCERFILAGIPLVDKAREIIYQSVLFQYLNKIEKNKIQFNSKEEHKIQHPTTNTNPAKSTPAGGKSKKGKQQNSSSQSTLTMLPQKDLSRRQIKLLAGAGAQITMITTAGKKEDIGEEERIVITDSQMVNAMEQ